MGPEVGELNADGGTLRINDRVILRYALNAWLDNVLYRGGTSIAKFAKRCIVSNKSSDVRACAPGIKR